MYDEGPVTGCVPLRNLVAALAAWQGRRMAVEVRDSETDGFLAGLVGRLSLVEFDEDLDGSGGRLRVELEPGPQELQLYADLVAAVHIHAHGATIEHDAASLIELTLVE